MATQNDMPTQRERELLMRIKGLSEEKARLTIACEDISNKFKNRELKFVKLRKEIDELHKRNLELCRQRDVEHTRSQTAYLRYRYEHWHMSMLNKMIHRMIEGVANETFISISTDVQIDELFKI